MDGRDWPEGLNELLLKICSEWDAAEAEIKRVELVCGEVILPSINELRYAGRRLVDVMIATQSKDSLPKVRALLADVTFNCHRARHDAIDAGAAKITADLADAIKSFGGQIVASSFSQLPALMSGLSTLREKIVASRENREDRDKIYTVISNVDFKELIRLHSELMAVTPILKPIAVEQQRRSKRDLFIGWGGWVLALIFGTITVLAWRYPHLLGG